MTTAADFLPDNRTLPKLREAAAGCRGCHLYEDATQTVFGAGLRRSRVMMVGEQPGDREDRQGHPFVGPAGRELDRALESVGIARGRSEEHTSELQSQRLISYAVFCLKKRFF